MIKRLNQVGDTIVEVLIAAAIVSLVLTGAFAVSNSSYKQIRMSQERGEAQRVAQSAVEQLDTLVNTNTALVAPTDPGPFCGTSAGLVVVDTASDCTKDLYHITIRRAPNPGDGSTTFRYTFTATITWDGLSGVQQQVAMDYRVGRVKLVP